MKTAGRLLALAAVAAALAGGLWLATRGRGPDRRDLDAVVTIGGDLVRDALRPAIDLTRLTVEEEIRLGRAIDGEVRARETVVTEGPEVAYLAAVARPLLPHVERPGMTYTFALLKTGEVNACAVAGGFVYVTLGMLQFAGSEAELAAVLGHEIAHVDLRHCVERLQFEQAARRIGPGLGDLARLGYEIMSRGFSEEQELAADASGALLAARGDYDPWQANELFGRLLLRHGDLDRRPSRNPVKIAAGAVPAALGRYLATHPPADQRIEAVRRALVAAPDLWRGRRLYVGRGNPAARRARADESRNEEWVVRRDEPPPSEPLRGAAPATPR